MLENGYSRYQESLLASASTVESAITTIVRRGLCAASANAAEDVVIQIVCRAMREVLWSIDTPPKPQTFTPQAIIQVLLSQGIIHPTIAIDVLSRIRKRAAINSNTPASRAA